MIRNIEKFIIVAGLAYLVGYGLAFFVQSFGPNLVMERGIDPALINSVSILGTILGVVPISLVCGIWLGSYAKKERRNPMAWFFFGLLFQVLGVVLFYAVIILTEIRKDKVEPVAGGDAAR